MSYQQYNIKDELKIMHLCGEICDIEKEIEKLRLQIGKLNDRKLDLGVEIDKIREAARASAQTGTMPLPPPA